MDLQSILTSSKVGDLALKTAPVCAPDETVRAAVEAMQSAGRGSVLVCSKGQLVGIFTERDLLYRLDQPQTMDESLSSVMTTSPTTTTTEDTLLAAIRSMDQGRYRRLPVIGSDGMAVGIVDVKAIVHFLVEHFPEAVYNQASHAQLIAKHREGA